MLNVRLLTIMFASVFVFACGDNGNNEAAEGTTLAGDTTPGLGNAADTPAPMDNPGAANDTSTATPTPNANPPIAPQSPAMPQTPQDNTSTCVPASPFGNINGSPWQAPAGCDGLYTKFGQYPVGVTTIGTDEAPIAVWYPGNGTAANTRSKAIYDMRDWLPESLNIPPEACTFFQMEAYTDLPAATGRFPVVVFSHGIAGYRYQSSAIMNHLASWGFVVAAPEHPERNLSTVLETGTIANDNAIQALRTTLAELNTANGDSGHILADRIDPERIASSGHSMGAAAASAIAADENVSAWFVMASPGFTNVDGKPILVMGGTTDAIATPTAISNAFDNLTATPRRYVSIEGAGHLGFSDICLVAREKGGVLGLAREYGIEVVDLLAMLGDDGCRESDLAPEKAFPIIGHYLVAHLRSSLGMDSQLNGFDDASRACFANAVADLRIVDAGENPTPSADNSLGSEGSICCGDGGVACDLAGQFCCSSWIGKTCRPECNQMFELTQACDGAEDCSEGQVCCKNADQTFPDSYGSTCRESCALGEEEISSSNTCDVAGGNQPPAPPVPGDNNQQPGEAGIVACGDIACNIADNLCCVDVQGSFSCESVDSCGQGAAPQACDGPEDCANGQQCCAGFPAGASCKAGCGNFELEICHTDADCGASGACAPCNPPGTTVNACSCPF